MAHDGAHARLDPNPVREKGSVCSGLAAGAIAGGHIAKLAGYENAVSLDMGGTSADISLMVDGATRVTTDWYVEYGYPIKFPSVEVFTIGAGGGSIAWIDPAGSLRNGPQSAGSDPGPACYGRGGDDFQKGGDGNDFIDGSKGDDTIVGGTGRDHVSPAAGNDDIDSVDGIAGNDTVGCGDGNDTARVDRDTAPDPDVTDHYFDDCEDVQFVNVGG